MGDGEIRMKKWGDRMIGRGSEECLQKYPLTCHSCFLIIIVKKYGTINC
jgi:hypothetical protein